MIYPAILSGGSGVRLWPMSRKLYPKQFHGFLDEQTLLQAAAKRVQSPNLAPPLVVCNHDHRFIVAEQLRAVGIEPSDIILEPSPKDTAPAITIAALCVRETDPDGLLLILPADHSIDDDEEFCRQIEALSKDAQAGKIVSFGVPATAADPELGYMKATKGNDQDPLAAALDSFVERPDRTFAEQLIKDGYSWYSGISLVRPDIYLAAMESFAPETLFQCTTAWNNRRRDLEFIRLEEETYEKIKPSSVDKTVMESSRETVMSPLAVQWRDLRNWSSVWDCISHDEHGNASRGETIFLETKNSLIYSEDRVAAVIGLDNVSIVSTDDAIYIGDNHCSDAVSKIVSDLDASGSTKQDHHTTIYRPWGCFHSVLSAPGFQVKELTVNPGATLSLQLHHHRAEHWVVVEGTAAVRRGEDDLLLHENQSTYIPKETVHRLSNPGRIPLRVIEVQSGTYLGEDDIVRLDDEYGRTGNTS